MPGIIALCFMSFSAFGQYESKNNNTGDWDSPATWIGGNYENDPVNNDYAAIQGFVSWYPSGGDSTLNFNLGGNPPGAGDTALVVRDTLIVNGNLNFANKNNLYIEENALLIIYGDLSGDNKITLDPKGYLIIEGDLNFNNTQQGDITNGDNMYLGGTSTNCGDSECSNINNDSTDLKNDSLGVYDYYNGQDPDLIGTFSIIPDTTDICSRSPQKVTLYFSDADNDNVDEFYWQTSPDGQTFQDSTGTSGEEDLEITSTSTRHFRVKYSTDGGSTFQNSDTAVVYCNTLCTMTASINLTSGSPDTCYISGIQFDYNATVTDGTSPFTYSWSISPADNSDGNPISETENSDQVTYTNFSNPSSTSEGYTVSLQVTDNNGCTDNASGNINLHRTPVTDSLYYVPNDFDQ
mgnify:CR=1 FL=1